MQRRSPGRGLSVEEPGTGSGAPRQLTVIDPDGNSIKFFADPAKL
jgi:hypothetical protein